MQEILNNLEGMEIDEAAVEVNDAEWPMFMRTDETQEFAPSSEVQAAGLSTTTVESMIRQRVRWARGVIQSIRNTNAVFTRKFTVAARLSYLNAYLYWWSFLCRMVFILAPILFALFGFRLVECGFWELFFPGWGKKRFRRAARGGGSIFTLRISRRCRATMIRLLLI